MPHHELVCTGKVKALIAVCKQPLSVYRRDDLRVKCERGPDE